MKKTKKEILKPTRGNSDWIKMLLNDEDFVYDIENVRYNFGIGEDGFRNKEEKLKFMQKKHDDDYMEITRISSETYSFRKGDDDKIIKNKIGELRNIKVRHGDDIWMEKLDRVSERLCIKYNLPINFKETIRDYIIEADDEELAYYPHNFKCINIGRHDNSKGTSKVLVEIYSQMTKDEMTRLEKELKLRTAKLPKLKGIRNLDKTLKDYDIYVDAALEDDVEDEIVSEKRPKITDIAKKVYKDKKESVNIYNSKRKMENIKKKRTKPEPDDE